MPTSPIHSHQKERGAEFGKFASWTLPTRFESLAEECELVYKGTGIADLSYRGKLRISGRDHLKFIQGMMSNDVVGLARGGSVYATMLNAKGRMLTDFTIYKGEGFLFCDLEPGMAEPVEEHLNKFKLSYKAQIENLSDKLALISVNGPNSGELVSDALSVNVDELGPGGFMEADTGSGQLMIASVRRTNQPGFDIYCPLEGVEKVWLALNNFDADFPLGPVGLDAMNTLRIEAGIPAYGLDMTEATIPLEAGLDRAISYEKGCYVGQEVVARIHWRGHVNWHLVGFKILDDASPGMISNMAPHKIPKSGDELFKDGKKVGHITSPTFSSLLGSVIALGYIRRELKEPGNIVDVVPADTTLKALVVELPFKDSL